MRNDEIGQMARRDILIAFPTLTNTWTISFTSFTARITETSHRRRESGGEFVTNVHISSLSAIARSVKSAGVFRSALPNASPRPSPVPLAITADVHQKIHLCENAGKLRFFPDHRSSIIISRIVGPSALNDGDSNAQGYCWFDCTCSARGFSGLGIALIVPRVSNQANVKASHRWALAAVTGGGAFGTERNQYENSHP